MELLFIVKLDDKVKEVSEKAAVNVKQVPYATHKHRIENGVSIVEDEYGIEHALEIFGEHNLQNLNGALLVCEEVGVSKPDFYQSNSKLFRSFKETRVS